MIRIARQDDIDQIMNIVEETIEDMHKESNFQWDDNYPTKYQLMEDINKFELYVEEKDNQVVGFICMNTKEDEAYQNVTWSLDSTALVIHRFAVKRDYQQQGIGTKLIEYAMSFARNKGYSYIKVDTNVKNTRMNQLLVKLGFQLVGQIELRQLPDLFNCYEYLLNGGEEDTTR